MSLNYPPSSIEGVTVINQSETRKKKIPVVEDEPIIGDLYRRILVAEGFDVDIACNGVVAKETAIKQHHNLCVSDIRLPEISGIELHKLLKMDQAQLAYRMIFMTGDTLNAGIQSFLQEPHMRCVLKPFSPEELIAAARGNIGMSLFFAEPGWNIDDYSVRKNE